MKFLITGGLGFIGSSFIRLAHAESQHEILNLDKESYASMPESLGEIVNSERYYFVKLNIHENEPLYKEIKAFKPDVILHFAAESHVDRSIDGPEVFIKSNITGTFNILDLSYQYWVDLGKDLKNKFKFYKRRGSFMENAFVEGL